MKPTRGALANFITEMQIGHREPALALMEKRQPAIENHPIRNMGLTREKGGHEVG